MPHHYSLVMRFAFQPAAALPWIWHTETQFREDVFPSTILDQDLGVRIIRRDGARAVWAELEGESLWSHPLCMSSKSSLTPNLMIRRMSGSRGAARTRSWWAAWRPFSTPPRAMEV